MGKVYPQLVVTPANMKHNMEQVVALAAEGGMEVNGVAKGFCCIPECCRAMLEAGCKSIGGARTCDLKKLKEYDPTMPTLLTRIPMKSEASEVVAWADISLVSELETLQALNEEALKQGKVHKVILMKDIGDRREGYYEQDEMTEVGVKVETEMPGLFLYGVGTNFGCYGSVCPTWEKLTDLVGCAEAIEAKIGRRLDIISTGGTQTLNLVPTKEVPERVNHLRCGICSITKAAYTWEADIPDRLDSFRLRAEIVELKEKPTMPNGLLGNAALNEKRHYKDLGIRKRAIVAIGRQDFGEDKDSIIPVDPKIRIWGSSSDHTILDLEDCETDYKLGDYVEFNINYVACMHLTMSRDVNIVINE
ncbi:MAG: alanine racemase [Firmicutes bacterium]|nr:alanine racemase [Bacillota bacterium]